MDVVVVAPGVVCVGIAVLDRVYQVPALATAAGKYRASARHVVGGGVAANAAVTVSRLGGAACFIGVVGNDDVGSAITSGLAEEGVDVAAVRTVVGQSPESVVQIDAEGERLIVNHASADLFEVAAPVGPDEIDDADAVLVDMRWPGGAVPALEGAAAAGVPGIVDCDHDPADAPGILEAASHVVFAEATLLAYTGASDVESGLRSARAELGCWVAATAGERGTHWLDDGMLRHHPAVPVRAVDTLGAGDVFHGAFALRVAAGDALPDAIEVASAAAALKCTRFGGRTGIPTQDELSRFMESDD